MFWAERSGPQGGPGNLSEPLTARTAAVPGRRNRLEAEAAVAEVTGIGGVHAFHPIKTL